MLKFPFVLNGEFNIYSDELGYLSEKAENAVISITVKAEKICTPLYIRIKTADRTVENIYYIPIQKTKICIPVEVSVSGKVELYLKTEFTIAVDEIFMEGRGDTGFNTDGMKGGMFLLDPYEEIMLSEQGLGVGETTDIVKRGNYLYGIGNGSLTVIDVTNADSPAVLGRLGGLGAVRQIALCSDGEHIIVTARQDGVFIINASNPRSPYIRSTYDSIEMATGLCVSGNYAFICDRQ